MDLDIAPEEEEEEQEEDLIPFMKAEVSAALTGIEEASYLRGILREFLRYASSCQPSNSLAQITDSSSNNPLSTAQPTHTVIKQGRAEIHTLISSRRNRGGVDDEKELLPLSLKAEPFGKDLKTKVGGRSGERVARSKRDISRLKSMRVGKYSFERIVI